MIITSEFSIKNSLYGRYTIKKYVKHHLNLQTLSNSELRILRLLLITKEGLELAFDRLILAVVSLRVYYKRHA